MTSNLQILTDLRLAMELKQMLELMLFYKGVPVICKAAISKIEDENATLVTHAPGIICIQKAEKVSILGGEYFEPSSAKVARVELKSGQVHLQDFAYLANRLGERMIVRVEPKAPLPVTLSGMEQPIQAELVDLSLNGAGIRLEAGQYFPALKPGTMLNAAFELPGEAIHLNATVISGTKSDDRFRISIGFTENSAQRLVIFRYLIDRRSEIEQEIQAGYQEALKQAES